MLRVLRLFILLGLLLHAGGAVAQEVSGRVLDATTAQPLPGAIVRLSTDRASGTVTAPDGTFRLALPARTAGSLTVELTGYRPLTIAVSTAPLTIRLAALAVRLAGAEVVGRAGQADPERHVKGTQLGETVLPVEALRILPVLFGEADPVKTLALLPGVQTGGEGQTGLYVRGGGQDQNLTLLDDATIYNAGHLLNFFSVFNTDALSTASLLKTPDARYGGRLSSVLAIEGLDGDPDSVRVRAGIGLVASRVVIEGPIGRRNASDSAQAPRPTFLLAGRRTYIDLLAKPFLKNDNGGVPYYFYDLNGRLGWRPSRRDRLSLTLYHGSDDGSFRLGGGAFTAGFGWGNTAASFRWQHTFTDRLRLRVATSVVDYRFRFSSRFNTYETRLLTFVRDYSTTAELDWQPSVRHTLRLGVMATHHTLRPRAGDAGTADGQTFTTSRVQTKYAQEAATWLTDDWTLTDRLLLSVGLRWSGAQQRGPYSAYRFDATGARVLDSIYTAKGRSAATFQTPEPRVALRWTLPGGQSSLKVGYSRTAQYVHLVSQATSALPLDVWVPASAMAPPQRAHAFSAGYFRSLGAEQEWEVSAEAYYRRLSGQLEYADTYVAGPINRDIEYEFVRGTGRAYGIELLARRASGRMRGWVAYTLARATRRFPDLNGGQIFPFRFDQRHNLSVVATYDLSERWLFGGTFTYATGQALTLPSRRYIVGNNVQFQYGERNGFRMPATHRLDLSATWQRPPRHRWRTRWQFSVYNVYGRRNPWFYYLDTTGDVGAGNGQLTARSVALFPLPVPAVTWEVSF